MNGAALALGRLYVGHCDPTFVPKDPTMPPGSTVLNGPVVIGGNIDGQLVKPLSTSALCNIIKPAEVTTTLVPVPTGMLPAVTAGLKISALGDGAVPYPGPGILANAVAHVISANVPVPPTAIGVNLLSSDMITMSSPAMTVTTNEVFSMINLGTKDVVYDDDGWTVRTRDGKFSAHYEHTICIKKNKADILSSFSEIILQEKNNTSLFSDY